MTAIRIENVTRRFGETVAVDAVNLEMPDGKLSFLLGPSGCGKTTLLRMIAGFIEVTAGRILFDGVDVSRIPANRREVGMVFQSYALWPHLTVAQNVAFGLEVRKLAKAKVDEGVARALSLVRMERYAARKPTELSGGQQQRVALARAIVYRPKVLLLDEPLSNLDAKLRHEMRNEIRRICDESRITTVYVTHDQEEALSLADRMTVLRDGRIEQEGEPREMYRLPRNRFVADFLGETNLIEGEIVAADAERRRVRTALGELVATGITSASPSSGRCLLSIRPEALGSTAEAVHRLPNVLTVDPIATTYLGKIAQHRYRAKSGLELHATELNPRGDRPTDTVTLSVASDDVVVLPT
jgi:iron(III) transport system ATP-binding protein